MEVINLSEHNSVLNQYLREIRDVNIQKDPLRFRRNIERIGEVMAIEVSKTLHYEPTEVQTPLDRQYHHRPIGFGYGAACRSALASGFPEYL